MKIHSIKFDNYKCFKPTEINCLKIDGKSVHQWTVLLGNNNTGKTSLLKAISNLRPTKIFTGGDSKKASSNTENMAFDYIPMGFLKRDSNTTSIHKDFSIQCTTSLKDVKEWGYTESSARLVQSNHSLEDFKIYGYGVSRYPSQTSLSTSTNDECASLFSSEVRLVNIEEWLMQLDYAAKNHNLQAEVRLSKIKELLCSNLFPEILDFKFESNDELHNYILFRTIDGWFRYTDLGYGYQSMFSWIIDLCKRMFERYPNSENPLLEEAIVLVDEIDLHLHPSWQRNVIPFLSKSFPNIQFIVTTHSPLVIQSMENVNLYVCHRIDNFVQIEKSSVEDYRGWTVEEILRDTMLLSANIHSDEYQNIMKRFDTALDENNKEEVKKAYSTLCKILHPSNPLRRLLEIQYKQLIND